MIYVFFGFCASLVGFALSPQFRLGLKDSNLGWYVVQCSLMMGGFIGIVSNICNHDVRMWYKSRLDYTVNVFVAASIGLTFSVVLLYFIKIDLVGRWVLILTLSAYVSIVVGWTASCNKKLGQSIYLCGGGAKMFVDTVYSSRIKTASKFVIISETDAISHLNNPVWRLETLHHRFYIIPDGDLGAELAAAVCAYGNVGSSCVMSVHQAFERELECVNISWIESHKWWDFKCVLRQSDYIRLKRILDLVLFSIICLPALILIGLAAIGIKLTDFGPIFFRQKRLGLFGKPFFILKLRSMVVTAENNGAQWASIGDTRVTRFGKLLRLTRVDELPQIWNILLGDMSFIGPRPERPEFFAVIENEYPCFRFRLMCKPGLTGWAQVNYPYGSSISDSIVKLMYDVYYIKHANISMEIKILIRTVFAMVKGAR